MSINVFVHIYRQSDGKRERERQEHQETVLRETKVKAV